MTTNTITIESLPYGGRSGPEILISQCAGFFVTILFTATLCSGAVPAAQDKPENPSDELNIHLSGFLNRYCVSCHGAEKPEAQLNLSGVKSPRQIVDAAEIWQIVLQRIESAEMPPADAVPQPAGDERNAVTLWLKEFLDREASRNAGDPGIVLARRLSNVEFDNTIRELTGVDIRPTTGFPVDPANQAGFDNSGESLTMSPALLKKYVDAVRSVADHLVLKTQGFTFAPYPILSETDRDRFCVQRIVEFYGRHQVKPADYLFVAWQLRLRRDGQQTDQVLADAAIAAGLSPRYLSLLWKTLHQHEEIGPIKELQAAWAALPADAEQAEAARAGCAKIGQLIDEIRDDLEMPIEQLRVDGISQGSQPLVLWWNRQVAGRRMMFPGDGDDASLDAARDRFCHVFPNVFAVSSRGHYSDAGLGAGVRLLSAGFHLMQGYFRDDQPLYELVLDENERRELDELWQDLNLVTQSPVRQYKDFLFFERAEPPQFAGGSEFAFARPEDKATTTEPMMVRMRDTYIARAREIGASDTAIEAIETYFRDMSEMFRWIEGAERAAELTHLVQLPQFAERAWRRPLTGSDRDGLSEFYRRLRDVDGLSHEDSMRDCIAGILLSPYFTYRFEFVDGSAEPAVTDADSAGDVRALTNYELASRLSYFLWAGPPDQELLASAAAGELQQSAVLVRQAGRMLRDERIRGLATEFLGNWLEFRRFEEHNAVDRDRFPAFTTELRSAMYEEPIRFFVDLAVRDGALTDLIAADHTFVNPLLAQHYEIPFPVADDGQSIQLRNSDETSGEWVRVDRAGEFGRGGLVPMSVFLTKNSPGLRTSPVKRGYWVVKKLLGEHIPAPPPNVPELPNDEAEFGDRTLSELLAAHRDHSACSGCHQRFDALGLIFEGYGPIGERRSLDLGGHPVQTHCVFPDGSAGDDFTDLRRYLMKDRQDDFIEHLVRQMFTFALGRSLQLSDTQTLEAATRRLAENHFQIGTLVEAIVTSPQFLNKRVRK